MVLYNFKKIQVVPPASDFVDIILSKTQRKTPTVIHRHYQISNIRKFYMRKVKYTQQNYYDRLTAIIDDFPLLDDIHPFYSDLMNVLYDRDHYKLALGQINTARQLITNIGKDYLRMLKFGDSLYRCKQLKRAAMGRMCTVLKKQAASLQYLEQVRQHLARLPSIDPDVKTLLLCGYPNVGKSSFVNQVSRVDAEVQPYAFTTKSLLVGHCDHSFQRYQILDTPGIIDHPLEERNTIEMLSITALAHLQASIVFLIDISEQCGYSIETQVALFESIKPLFVGKPLVVGLNKIDVLKPEDLREDAKSLLRRLEAMAGVTMIPLSTHSTEGVSRVKETACDKLSAMRVDQKLSTLNRDAVLRKLHVAMPTPRDHKQRPANIPDAYFAKKEREAREKEGEMKGDDGVAVTEVKIKASNVKPGKGEGGTGGFVKKKRNVNEQARPNWVGKYDKWRENLWDQANSDPNWDPTTFQADQRENYLLSNDEWRFDNIPEIMDGMNVADWIDPEILEKLKYLEEMEEERIEEETEQAEKDKETDFFPTAEQEAAIRSMVHEKKMSKLTHDEKQGSDGQVLIPRAKKREGRGIDDFEAAMTGAGLDAGRAVARMRERSVGRERKRKRDDEEEEGGDMEEDGGREVSVSRERSTSRARSKTPREEGLKDEAQLEKVDKMKKKSQKRPNKKAKKGEGDRVILNMKPKHLSSLVLSYSSLSSKQMFGLHIKYHSISFSFLRLLIRSLLTLLLHLIYLLQLRFILQSLLSWCLTSRSTCTSLSTDAHFPSSVFFHISSFLFFVISLSLSLSSYTSFPHSRYSSSRI
eukprot:TRINITY_DN22460_c0_g1_i1.p1 TRINITY_DN22460_c0_g1~~TRINITY_DN22460_c0_g1_i1.p1  ORF type:complete len:812 (-),score=234.86 TRINITY_DN22460_c0_g1_i1:1889-4324(-)